MCNVYKNVQRLQRYKQSGINNLSIMILICSILCVLAALLLVGTAAWRLHKQPTLLSGVLLALSALWFATYVCGSLRLSGVLPPVDDAFTQQQITHFMGSKMPAVAVGCFTLVTLAVDAFLFILIRRMSERNKLWWICGGLFAFLAVIFVVACAVKVFSDTSLSLDQLFFGGCCASMALPGWALGFTYKEICVLVNIYLEAGLCLLSALWLAKVLVQRRMQQASGINTVLAILGGLYAALFLAAFIGIVAYYPPPLDDTFNKCYRDLQRWASDYHSTYNIVNYLIFIVGFLVPVLFNCLLGFLLQPKKEKVAPIV